MHLLQPGRFGWQQGAQPLSVGSHVIRRVAAVHAKVKSAAGSRVRQRTVVLQVDEYADDPLLAEMGIDHPLDLTGVYEGIPIGERSVETSGTLPDRIRLFRQPILTEWAEEGEPFEHLVRHILIHEVGHHFGLSDEDMHALEEQA